MATSTISLREEVKHILKTVNENIDKQATNNRQTFEYLEQHAKQELDSLNKMLAIQTAFLNDLKTKSLEELEPSKLAKILSIETPKFEPVQAKIDEIEEQNAALNRENTELMKKFNSLFKKT